MPNSLWNQTLADFRDATASSEPTPGGGSVAMVSAAFGAGLVVMALEITGNKPEAGTEAVLAELLREGRTLLAELSGHADADVAVFQAYMAALKLPKQTDAEKATRKQELQVALVKATRVPLAAAEACVAGLELAGRAADDSSVRVVSDVGAGAALLGGAAAAVLLNVDINLPGVTEPALRDQFARRRLELGAQAAARTAAVLHRVSIRIATGK